MPTPQLVPVRRALLSVSDKTGLSSWRARWPRCGVELVSTGGTRRRLREAGMPVHDVSESPVSRRSWTAASRRCTRRSTAACSAARGTDDAVMAAARHRADRPGGREPLSVRGDGRASPDCTLDDAIENIDIGGPAMLRAAAKNHERRRGGRRSDRLRRRRSRS